MKEDNQPPFRPSPRFVAIHGEGVSPTQAERILTGVLYNHDTVPDLVTVTCQMAASRRRGVTFIEVAEVMVAEGASFDAEGWLATTSMSIDGRRY
jgi:hypothetical protein